MNAAPTRRQTVVIALVLAVVALAVHVHALDNEFVWDDPIVFDRQLPYFDSARSVFFPPAGIPQFGQFYYRPLVLVSYLVDEGIAKTFWPLERRAEARRLVYHASPVAYHMLATALVFVLGLALLRDAGRLDEAGAMAAAGAGLLFAAHPIHVESVAWMAGRSDTLCAVFFLASVLAYLRFRREGRRRWLAAALVAAFASMLSKETGVGVVLMVAGIELLRVLRGGSAAESVADFAALSTSTSTPAPAPPRRKAKRGGVPATPVSPAHAAPKRPLPLWLVAVLVLLVAAAYGLMRRAAFASMRSPALDKPAEFGDLPWALGWYVAKLVWPPPFSVFVAGVPREPWLLVLGLAAPLAALAAVWWWRRSRAAQPALHATGLFFASLAPSLAIAVVAISKTPLAERYLYIPSAGACLLLAFVALEGLRRVAPEREAWLRWGPALLCVALAVPASIAAVDRGAVWNDNLSFWNDAVRKAPGTGVPHLHLGITYFEKGRYAEAIEEYKRALAAYETADGRSKALNNMGSAYMQLGRLDEAIGCFRDALRENPAYETPHYNWAIALLTRTLGTDAAVRQPALAEAEQLLRRAIALNPRYVKALLQHGRVLAELGRLAEARERLAFVVQIAPASREGADARTALAALP